MHIIYCENDKKYLYDEKCNKIFLDTGEHCLIGCVDKNNQIIKRYKLKQSKFFDNLGRDCSIVDGIYRPFTNKLTDLTIQLGTNCNLKCIYCAQNYCSKDSMSHSDIESFLKRLKKAPINWANLQRIQLQGGEPLVYWKHFVKIVEFVRKNIPKFRGYFHTTINGTLLTKDIADFFIKHGIHLQISHNGVNQKALRDGKDQTENEESRQAAISLLRDRNLGSINYAVSPMFNPNLFDSLNFFEEVLPDVPLCFRTVIRCDSTNQKLLNLYTKENIEVAKESYFRIITLQPGDKQFEITKPTRYKLFNLCQNFIYEQHPASIDFGCPSMQRYEMCFNLKGNFIPCHGATESMNHGVGSIDDVKSCYCVGFTSVTQRKICQHCVYTQICQGPCGMHNDIDAQIHCRSIKWASEVQFDSVWKTLFGVRPITIERID